MSKEDKTIKVLAKADSDNHKPDASVKLVESLTNTPKERMPETTYLSKHMAFMLSVQRVLDPKLVFDDDVDILDEWEQGYFKLQRSVGGEHLMRLTRLTEIEMAGAADEDISDIEEQ